MTTTQARPETNGTTTQETSTPWAPSYPATPVPNALQHGAGVEGWFFDFADKQGYEYNITIGCKADSIVLASISEVGNFGGQLLPFVGLASMSVDNISPNNDGTVRIRGSIGWDSNLNARLSILMLK